MAEIGKPEENPEREIVPLYDPVPREVPSPVNPEVKPIKVPVPA